ncbi:MAG: hypothetical protein ABEI74_00540 [Candidatus Pacearchaeota archaeon]
MKNSLYNFINGIEGVQSNNDERPYLFSKDNKMQLPSVMEEGKTLTNKFGQVEKIYNVESFSNTNYYQTFQDKGGGLELHKTYQEKDGQIVEISREFKGNEIGEAKKATKTDN